MKLLTRSDFLDLQEFRSSVSASMYLPTHRAGTGAAGAQKDRIVFKNLLQEYERRLAAKKIAADRAAELAAPLHSLYNDAQFWQHSAEGLAVFRGPDFLRTYRLPAPFEPGLFVDERFYLKPLLPLLTGDGRFYVLAVSQKDVRLLEATRNLVRVNDLSELVPGSVDEIRRASDPEKSLQQHGTRSAGQFHGQGAGRDRYDAYLRKYLRQVSRAVQQIVGDDDVPLVFAGVDFLFPLYREVNRYPYLVGDSFLPGNPERENVQDLHRRAWELVEPRFRARERRALDKFREHRASARTSTDIGKIAPAARNGRVETLFLVRRVTDAEHSNGSAPGVSDDLVLNDLAVETLLRGGQVFVVANNEMPAASVVAALFRY